MRREAPGEGPRLAGLLGRSEEEVVARLGPAASEVSAPGGGWRTWEGEGWRLRVRLGGPEADEETDPAPGGVASWSLRWERGAPGLREAVEPLGLWPAAAPDERAAEAERPMVRRALASSGGPDRTLTAVVREGLFVRVTAFDEPPDWR